MAYLEDRIAVLETKVSDIEVASPASLNNQCSACGDWISYIDHDGLGNIIPLAVGVVGPSQPICKPCLNSISALRSAMKRLQ